MMAMSFSMAVIDALDDLAFARMSVGEGLFEKRGEIVAGGIC